MTILRPYGDTTGDGMVQLSFTLPMPHSKTAEGAAAQLANKMGMDPAMLVHGAEATQAAEQAPDKLFGGAPRQAPPAAQASSPGVAEREQDEQPPEHPAEPLTFGALHQHVAVHH